MKEQWYENLRCPLCGKTGKASLSGDNGEAATVDQVPDGFKVVDTEDGPNFHCASCEGPVRP
jgi:hypothetical protein